MGTILTIIVVWVILLVVVVIGGAIALVRAFKRVSDAMEKVDQEPTDRNKWELDRATKRLVRIKYMLGFDIPEELHHYLTKEG